MPFAGGVCESGEWADVGIGPYMYVFAYIGNVPIPLWKRGTNPRGYDFAKKQAGQVWGPVRPCFVIFAYFTIRISE